ncbi:hypothetical protein KYY02_20050 [Streptomyces pimonensis]|uniref:Uncharacterized protein n=1 Tax=Streptomyces pimonensis TaxID=2860288 RepID=A0ABV4J4F7_9ACTN
MPDRQEEERRLGTGQRLPELTEEPQVVPLDPDVRRAQHDLALRALTADDDPSAVHRVEQSLT